MLISVSPPTFDGRQMVSIYGLSFRIWITAHDVAKLRRPNSVSFEFLGNRFSRIVPRSKWSVFTKGIRICAKSTGAMRLVTK